MLPESRRLATTAALVVAGTTAGVGASSAVGKSAIDVSVTAEHSEQVAATAPGMTIAFPIATVESKDSHDVTVVSVRPLGDGQPAKANGFGFFGWDRTKPVTTVGTAQMPENRTIAAGEQGEIWIRLTVPATGEAPSGYVITLRDQNTTEERTIG